MKYLISFLLLLFWLSLPAEDAEEKLLAVEEETFHANEISELLAKLKQHPINLNSADEKSLQQLPWLSREDIGLILQARKAQTLSSGKDLEQLGINAVTVNEIQDYISFSQPAQLHGVQILRAEYNEAKQEWPSSLKYYQRLLIEYGRFNFGLLSQKDEGESDPLDFYSWFVQYRSETFLKNLVVGKYRIALGQGVLFAPKLGMSKSAEATSVARRSYSSLKPYTSSYEIWDLQGAATELALGSFRLIPFLSRSSLNANLNVQDHITSFNESGLNLDSSKKANVQETLFGSALEYQFQDNLIGAVGSSMEFDHNFLDPAKAKQYEAVSCYFNLFNSSIPLFGEIAQADAKWAGLVGCRFGEREFRQLLLLRHYEKDFPTWHGHPFSAQSNFENETGLYYGATILPRRYIKINCYFDLWTFPQTRFFEKMPTSGSEQFLQAEIRLPENTLRFTVQNKQKEKYMSLQESKIRDYQRLLLRLDWWQRYQSIIFKSRGEFVAEYLPEDEVYGRGLLCYQQFKLQLQDLQLIAQISFYRSVSEQLNVKHYMYENNVSGIMQNSVLSGDGIATYLLLKWQLSSFLEVQAKISDRWQEQDRFRLFCQLIGTW